MDEWGADWALLPLLLCHSQCAQRWPTHYFNIYLGQEYPAVVEFAPFQKISKKKLKKKDAKAGSIEDGITTLTSSQYLFLTCQKYFTNAREAHNQYLAFVKTFPDPEYKRFLENYSCDEEKSMANPETLLGEIEAKTRELIGRLFVS